MPGGKKRYAQVGIGGRSRMYTNAIANTYKDSSELVGMCDVNQGRMDYSRREFFPDGRDIPTYRAEDFEKMIAETKPDTVIVTTVDATHAKYIVRAMELGCDVVTEKPMTTDEVSCRDILHTINKTGRTCQVTFNYRYAPPRSQVKELLASGLIGKILSVKFEYMLDTHHGADYYRRWHRQRKNSGSLLVHKATHHFDLVNWFLDDVPEEVFAHGTHLYYTPETALERGLEGRGERCLECPVSDRCDFYFDLTSHERLKAMYLDCEKEDGYFRDRCVFGREIDIFDNMSVTVRYRGGALLNYLLHSFCPTEGYKFSFNGTKGRLEHEVFVNTYISGDETVPGELWKENVSIRHYPEFHGPKLIEVRHARGGHGGGDDPLLDDVFNPNPPADPLKRKAGHRDGAFSILIGVAAYHSIDSGKAVKIADLLGDAPV